MQSKYTFAYCLVIAWLLMCMAVPASYAQVEEDSVSNCDLSEPVLLSSIHHPKIQSFYQPLLKRVYADIGVNVDFVITTSYRDLMLVEHQSLSGSVAFAEDIIDTIPGVIKVRPALANTSYMLLCNPGKYCDPSILMNRKQDHVFAVSNAMSKTLVTRFPQTDTKNMVVTSDISKVMQLMHEGRVDYGVYPVSDRSRGGTSEIPVEFNYVPLYDIPTYHVIGPKLLCLLPKLEVSLGRALKNI